MQHEGSHNCNGEHHISVPSMLTKGFITQDQLEAYTTFRVVRHPLDWLMTCWLRVRQPHQTLTFWDWLQHYGKLQMMESPKGRTLFWRYQGHAFETFNLEGITPDLTMYLTRYTGCPQFTVGTVGKTEDKPNWRDVLTVTQHWQAIQMYPDIQYYGYKYS